MNLGYQRTSTHEQNLVLQTDALNKVGCDRIFTDQVSGSVIDRPGLNELLEFAREGDTIVARLFALGSAATWLIAEYDPEEKVAFGYADLFGQGVAGGAEWGYFCLAELAELRFMGIPRVEVDSHFTPKPFSECVRPDGSII